MYCIINFKLIFAKSPLSVYRYILETIQDLSIFYLITKKKKKKLFTYIIIIDISHFSLSVSLYYTYRYILCTNVLTYYTIYILYYPYKIKLDKKEVYIIKILSMYFLFIYLYLYIGSNFFFTII